MNDVDPFAEAFREIAEATYKESPDETVQWLREYIDRRVEQDGKTPDIIIVTSDEEHNEIHNNGLAGERIVWLAKVAEWSTFTHAMGEDDD